jgi:hypothetical protein
MSSAETDYSFRPFYPDPLVRARAQTVAIEVWRSGALVAPTEAGSTFKLYERGEDLDTGTPLISKSVAVGTKGYASVSVLAADLPDTLAFGRGYLELWHLVLPDGSSRDISRPAALVRHPLHPTLVESDFDPRAELAAHRKAGITSWQTYMDQAWSTILAELEEDAAWPEQIWNSGALWRLHKRLTLLEIYTSFARSQGGRWLDLVAGEEKAVEFAWRKLKVAVDGDQDGHAEDPNSVQSVGPGVIFGNVSPTPTYNQPGLRLGRRR